MSTRTSATRGRRPRARSSGSTGTRAATRSASARSQIGESAIEQTAALLGVTETEPVDFFIYADEDSFCDALGPGTRENVGGQADAEIRTLFALIPPAQIDDAWVEAVIPHELTHLVFDTAADNPYHFPPRWLNEGLAVYESEGYGPSDRIDVAAAASDGTLIPLAGLIGQFPTSGDRFRLAYAESVSAVDFLIRTYGKDALVRLIHSYADGRTDDEAFQAAIGLSMAGFSDAWLADHDAKAPVKAGAATRSGRSVAGWLARGRRPRPRAARRRPQRAPRAPTAPVTPASTSPSGPPDATSSSSSSSPVGTVAAIVILAGVLVAAGVLLARRRRGSAT